MFPRSLLSESDVIIPSNMLEAYKKKGVVSLEILTAQKLGLKGTRLTEVLMRFVRATLYNKLSCARILIGSHL